jgi:hypothetical protein
MKAFNDDVYVPLILTKRGERRALNDLPSGIKDNLRPVFVVHPPEVDFATKTPKKQLADHINVIAVDLAKAWAGRDAFVDATWLGDATVSGVHPLTHFLGVAAANGLSLTPVLRADSTAPYTAAIGTAVMINSDVCLRLQQQWWPSGNSAGVDALLAQVGANPSDAHFILDLQDDVGTSTGHQAASELQLLPHSSDWKSLTVASTAIPADMPTGPGIHTIPRNDLRIYTALCGLTPALPRTPTFGDYAINGVTSGPTIDPRVMNISATLRYTIDDQWLIAKGGLYKGNGGKSQGGAAVPAVAQLLANHNDFLGWSHCAFEAWLQPVVANGPGSSPETWRRHATHHHLCFTTNQIATMSGSVGVP